MRARCNFVEQHYRGPMIDVGIGSGAFIEARRNRATYGYDVNPAGVEFRRETVAELNADLFRPELLREKIAQPDACAGIVDARAPNPGQPWPEQFELRNPRRHYAWCSHKTCRDAGRGKTEPINALPEQHHPRRAPPLTPSHVETPTLRPVASRGRIGAALRIDALKLGRGLISLGVALAGGETTNRTAAAR